MVFESSVLRNSTSNSSINKKNDLSFKILELLNTNQYNLFSDRNKLPTLITSLLNKVINKKDFI